VPGERVRALVRFECARAREYYASARRLLPPEDARALVPAEIMAGIYRDILRRVERSNFDVFSAPIRVPRVRRAAIATSIWARSLAGFRASA
jgi:phytoene synthase